MSAEKRRHRRFMVDLKGQVDTGNQRCEVEVMDISSGGVRIRHQGEILQGQSCDFRLLPDVHWNRGRVVVHDIFSMETISSIVLFETSLLFQQYIQALEEGKNG